MAASAPTKIKVENPVVDILGDEMTRIIWDVRIVLRPELQCENPFTGLVLLRKLRQRDPLRVSVNLRLPTHLLGTIA